MREDKSTAKDTACEAKAQCFAWAFLQVLFFIRQCVVSNCATQLRHCPHKNRHFAHVQDKALTGKEMDVAQEDQLI